MEIKLFTPIESMNPIYLGAPDEDLYNEVIKAHNGSTLAEIKEDGYRMQIHKKGDEIRAFTRSMNPIILNLFPELRESFKNLPDCILDAELIGDKQIGKAGFDFVKKRFRSRISQKGLENYLKSELIGEMPLATRVFDTLYWENRSLIDKTTKERRRYTEAIKEKKIIPSIQRLITNPDEIKNWFEDLTSRNYEGLVCKNPNAPYRVGEKTQDWVKIKRCECLDLAVLGFYMAGNEISQILCGPYNEKNNSFETLAKVNAKRKGLNKELDCLSRYFIKEVPENVKLNPIIEKAGQMPDYFIYPKNTKVVEVAAMNFNRAKNWHSCGLENGLSYSMRIGWLKQIRDDKSYNQASTLEQVKILYNQERKEC